MDMLQPRQPGGAALSDKAARTGRAADAPTAMKIGLAGLALLALAPAMVRADGRPADPLRSPQCLAARADLDALLAQAGAPHARQLGRARREAARACLGGSEETRQRSGAPQPPQAVPPVAAWPQRPAAPSVPAPLPALPIPRPTVITTCDPAGCWDSQGRRLNQMGPLLVGPHGVCTIHGALVTCP